MLTTHLIENRKAQRALSEALYRMPECGLPEMETRAAEQALKKVLHLLEVRTSGVGRQQAQVAYRDYNKARKAG